MIRCRNCGFGNSDDVRFCEECGEALTPRANGQEDETRQLSVSPTIVPEAVTDLPTRDSSISTIPGTGIALGEGEHLWRTYPILHFRPFRPRARGTLYITDSRIVLHAKANKLTGRTILLEETRLESVTGFGSYIDRGMGLLGTLLVIIVLVYSVHSLISGNRIVGGVLLLVTAVVVFITYYYGRMGLRVYTQGTTPGSINFGNFGQGSIRSVLGSFGVVLAAIGGVQAVDVLYCFPEHDVYDVITELGALVFDLNRKGTLAGTQWELP